MRKITWLKMLDMYGHGLEHKDLEIMQKFVESNAIKNRGDEDDVSSGDFYQYLQEQKYSFENLKFEIEKKDVETFYRNVTQENALTLNRIRSLCPDKKDIWWLIMGLYQLYEDDIFTLDNIYAICQHPSDAAWIAGVLHALNEGHILTSENRNAICQQAKYAAEIGAVLGQWNIFGLTTQENFDAIIHHPEFAEGIGEMISLLYLSNNLTQESRSAVCKHAAVFDNKEVKKALSDLMIKIYLFTPEFFNGIIEKCDAAQGNVEKAVQDTIAYIQTSQQPLTRKNSAVTDVGLFKQDNCEVSSIIPFTLPFTSVHR